MYTLKEVKTKIFKTECRDFICEGLCCSEPVLSKDEHGIVDNYFIYACNDDATIFSKPLVLFGVYSETETVAYVMKTLDMEDKEYKAPRIKVNEEIHTVYNRYSELYPQIRDFAFEDCNVNQKDMLKEYVQSLEKISGTVLYGFYQTLIPQFFDWVKNQGVI